MKELPNLFDHAWAWMICKEEEESEPSYRFSSTGASHMEASQRAPYAERRSESAPQINKKDAMRRKIQMQMVRQASMCVASVFLIMLILYVVLDAQFTRPQEESNTKVGFLNREIYSTANLKSSTADALLNERINFLSNAVNAELGKPSIEGISHSLLAEYIMSKFFELEEDSDAYHYASRRMHAICDEDNLKRRECHLYTAVRFLAKYPRKIEYTAIQVQYFLRDTASIRAFHMK